MISTNIQDFVKVYPKFVNDELCSKLMHSLKLKEWDKHQYHTEATNTNHSYDDDLYVLEDPSVDGNVELMNTIWNSIHRYICEDMKNCIRWFDSWHGHSMVRYNKYPTGTRMRIHSDHITTLFDGTIRGIPTLTVLGALNSEYEGGEFVMFGDKQIELDAGSIIVFPSNFMFPHEVLPVTKGTRYSFVSWVW